MKIRQRKVLPTQSFCDVSCVENKIPLRTVSPACRASLEAQSGHNVFSLAKGLWQQIFVFYVVRTEEMTKIVQRLECLYKRHYHFGEDWTWGKMLQLHLPPKVFEHQLCSGEVSVCSNFFLLNCQCCLFYAISSKVKWKVQLQSLQAFQWCKYSLCSFNINGALYDSI